MAQSNRFRRGPTADGQVLRQAEVADVGQNSGPASGTATVTVACKVPNGLHMQLYDSVREDVMDLGGNKIPSFRSSPRPGAPAFILRGPAVDVDRMRRGIVSRHQIVQGARSGTGFGLTPGVPRAFWEEWSRAPKYGPDGRLEVGAGPGYDFVRTGQVFAMPNDREAAAMAREMADEPSGLEPLDPDNPGPRMGMMRGELRQADRDTLESPE